MRFSSNSIALPALSLSILAASLGMTQAKKLPSQTRKNKSQGGMAGEVGPMSTSHQTKVGASCKSDNPDQICLALKYVVYRNSSGRPNMDEKEVVKTIRGINKVWNQCGIQFQVDEFVAVSPNRFGLEYNTANDSELYDVRKSFEDEKTLLVVNTGTWNRTGSLGSTGANAWTSMPGDAPYGVVLEKPVDTYSNIVAHELGHYLNLAHEGNAGDLMNPIIYDNSTVLSEYQCSAARDAATTYWQRMMR